MKGAKARSLSHSSVDVDECSVAQGYNDAIIDEELSKFLEIELSNAKCDKVRKLMSSAKKVLSSKYGAKQLMHHCMKDLRWNRWSSGKMTMEMRMIKS